MAERDPPGATRSRLGPVATAMFLLPPAWLLLMFAVDLPEAGLVDARVVWRRTTLHGCTFLEPVRRASISAALLRAAAGSSGQERGDGD